MIEILRKIYEENDFQVKKLTDEILFSEKLEQEYYITARYNEEELDKFFELDKTNEIIMKFEELSFKKRDIKKNTSLIIFIETRSIEYFYNKYRNSLFKIEEDEYFFRKYVIVYSKDSIKKIKSDANISNQIHEILLTEDRMEEFQNKYYADEEFFVALQLIVNFPFFKFERKKKEFKSLTDEIDKVILSKNLKNTHDALKNFNENFLADQTVSILNKLEDSFLSEESDDDVIVDFFKHFEVTNL